MYGYTFTKNTSRCRMSSYHISFLNLSDTLPLSQFFLLTEALRVYQNLSERKTKERIVKIMKTKRHQTLSTNNRVDNLSIVARRFLIVPMELKTLSVFLLLQATSWSLPRTWLLGLIKAPQTTQSELHALRLAEFARAIHENQGTSQESLQVIPVHNRDEVVAECLALSRDQ